MQRRLLIQLPLAVPLAATLGARAARAALLVGATAPLFTAEAALDGRSFPFDLAAALRDGPVVLYFYPKAFTRGCTIEANLFAENAERFKARGATVIGMSNDDIETLKRFSVEACRSRFAVAADAGAKVMKAYDATLLPSVADRISYLIARDRRIVAVHEDRDPETHVQAMLAAVEQLQGAAR